MIPVYDYFKEKRGGDSVFIFPDIPFWSVGDNGIDYILQWKYGQIPLSEMEKTLHDSFNYDDDSIKKTIIQIDSLLDGAGVYTFKENGNDFLEKPGDRFPNPVINVTRKCNLHCKHCYADAGGEKWNNSRDMTFEEIRIVIDKILENYYLAAEDKRILLSGGEPFLRDDILSIIKYINEVGGTPLVNSNALLIEENDMDILRNNSVELLVSLDGMTKEAHEFLRGANTFDKTIEKIKLLKKHGVIVKLSITLHKKNLDQLESFLEFAESNDIDGVAINILNVFDRARYNNLDRVTMKEMNRLLLKYSKKSKRIFDYVSSTDFANYGAILLMNLKFISCGVGSASLVVDFDGSIYPCYNNMRDDCKIGNAITDDIKHLWINSPVLKSLRKLDVNSFCKKCNKCPVKYYCGGGCRGEAFFQNKTLYCSCPNCDDIKEGIIDLMFLISEEGESIFLQRKEYFNSIDLNAFKAVETD